MRLRKQFVTIAAAAVAALLLLAGPAAAEPTITVTPDDGLEDGDTVTVEGSGFSPGLTLMVLQCAEGAAGAQDCNIAGSTTVQSDDDGNATAELTIITGPIGAGDRSCDAENACVVSMGEASPDPDAERAVVPVSFAGEADAEAPADEATTQETPEVLADTGLPSATLLVAALLALGVGVLALARGRRLARR